jgi:hypothetical protein
MWHTLFTIQLFGTYSSSRVESSEENQIVCFLNICTFWRHQSSGFYFLFYAESKSTYRVFNEVLKLTNCGHLPLKDREIFLTVNTIKKVRGHSNNTWHFLAYFRPPSPMCHLVTLARTPRPRCDVTNHFWNQEDLKLVWNVIKNCEKVIKNVTW